LVADVNLDSISLSAVVLIFITSLFLFVSRDWRTTIVALALQYLGVFILVSISWPLEIAVIKLVAGWMATVVLGTTQGGDLESDYVEKMKPTGGLFRLIVGVFVALIVLSIAPKVREWVPELGVFQILGGLILMGIGVLGMGLSLEPLRMAVGLLMIFAGFEIFYAVVEQSALVAGLLALINLMLALVASYLYLAPNVKDSGEAN